jgi:transcription elongation factor Elf1
MGSYDTLRVRCPKCGKQTEQQTKAGDCMLKRYTVDNAPLDILAGVQNQCDAGKVQCEHCGVKWTLKVQRIVTVEEFQDPDKEPEW